MMSIQSNTLGHRLDVDLDLYNPLKGEGTAKLEIKELDFVVDSFDPGCVNARPLAMENRTYVSGKMLRSALAMVVIYLRRSVIGGTDNVE